MRLRTAILSAAALVLSGPLLSASVTYNYTGQDLTQLNPADTNPNPVNGEFYNGTDYITGSITLQNALGANLGFGAGDPGYNIIANLGSTDIVQWSFSVIGPGSSAIQTISSSTSPVADSFTVWTDGSGNIEFAQINLDGTPTLGTIQINVAVPSNYPPGTVTGFDVASFPGVQNAGGYNDQAQSTGLGTWTPGGGSPTTPPPTGATPEPSSFVLMFTALLGFGFAARKQLVPRLLFAGRIAR